MQQWRPQGLPTGGLGLPVTRPSEGHLRPSLRPLTWSWWAGHKATAGGTGWASVASSLGNSNYNYNYENELRHH